MLIIINKNLYISLKVVNNAKFIIIRILPPLKLKKIIINNTFLIFLKLFNNILL